MKRIIEELCMDPDCQQKPDTHWHPFSIDLFGEDGEYTVTLRVRTLGKRKTRYSPSAGRKR